MKIKELLPLLTREDEEATVRISMGGEQPAEVRVVAHIEGEGVVVMAVPNWRFMDPDPIDSALALVPREPSQLSWNDVYKATSGGNWNCRLHDLEKGACASCKDLVRPGWHWGAGKTERYCNGHSIASCKSCGSDPWKEMTA